MGMESYASRTAYQPKASDALYELQQQVFADKGYRFGADDGAHSIKEAREFAAEDGTGSVLDIQGINEEIPLGEFPYEEMRFLLCRAVTPDELQEFFGKTQLQVSDIETIDTNEPLWESLGRGESRYLTLYQDDKPVEYYFIGFSFD